jgi:ParB family transcriptional regulator, chromosome partitioning protein
MAPRTKTETPPPGPVTLQAFVPAELDMDDNYRTDAEATITKEWVAVLAEHAKHSPPFTSATDPDHAYPCGNGTPVALFTKDDGTPKLMTGGGRRVLGCLRAGVFVLGYIAGAVTDDAAVQRARLIDQLTENTGRVGTSRSDEARHIAQLFELKGTTVTAVARAAGMRKADVEAARQVAASELAGKAADRYAWMTLDQCAVLEEFRADTEAVTRLVQASRQGDGNFAHELARLRSNAAERAARVAFEAELEAAGLHIYGDRPFVPWTMDLANLRDGTTDEPLTPESHADCPHRAVTIGYDWQWDDGAEAAYRAAHGLAGDDDIDFGDDDEGEIMAAGFRPRWAVTRYLCTDPAGAGHVNVKGEMNVATGPTPEQQQAQDQSDSQAKASEERRRVIAQNKLWRAATEVRRDHLKKWLAAPRLPKALDDAVTRLRAVAIALNETQPEMGSFGHRVAAQLLGLTDKHASDSDMLVAAIGKAAPARVKVIELAMVLGACEHGCGGADGHDAETWRSAESAWFSRAGRMDRRVRYLAWIALNTGYTLSEIEAGVVAAGTPTPKPEPPEDTPAPGGTGGGVVSTGPAAFTPVDTGGGIPDAATRSYPGDPATDSQGRVCIVLDGEDPADHDAHGHEYDPDTQHEPGYEDEVNRTAIAVLAVDAGHLTPEQARTALAEARLAEQEAKADRRLDEAENAAEHDDDLVWDREEYADAEEALDAAQGNYAGDDAESSAR